MLSVPGRAVCLSHSVQASFLAVSLSCYLQGKASSWHGSLEVNSCQRQLEVKGNNVVHTEKVSLSVSLSCCSSISEDKPPCCNVSLQPQLGVWSLFLSSVIFCRLTSVKAKRKADW